MKNIKVTITYCLTLLFFNFFGQISPIQYSFPTPSDAYILTLPLNQYFGGIFLGGNHILSGNNMVVPQLKIGSDAKMELKASKSIQMSNGQAISAFSTNGGFSAYISNDVLDIASFYPNQFGWSQIGRYDRFEIGIKLPAAIDQQVEDFLNNLPGINPYDMDVIRLEGDFQSIATMQTFTREGFYYRDISVTSNSYTPSKSQYPFRIRFAPPENGVYKFNLRLIYNGSTIASFNGGEFDVDESGKKGIIFMGNNNHFKDRNENDFFAIGQDFAPVEQIASPDLPSTYDTYRSMIENLYVKGGNFMRINVCDGPQFSVEWEELGVYGSARKPNEKYKRQCRSHELDKVFEKMESHGIYAQLTLVTDQITTPPYPIVGYYGHPVWSDSPYYIFGDHGWLNFYENASAISQFKKSLRYIHARYGYSSNLAIYETNNETNFLGKGLSNSYLTTASTRTKVRDWAVDIADFLKNGINYPSHLTTIAFAGTDGQYPGETDNPAGDPIYDLRSPHSYGHEKEITKTRFDQAKKHKNGDFFHPAIEGAVLFGELGGTDGFEIDACFDQEFHNGMWATGMSGATGAGLYRYGYQRNELREHVSAVSAFFSSMPFQTNHFNTKHDKNGAVECIFNVNDSGTRGFGWVHNYDYYWAADLNYSTNAITCTFHNPPNGHPDWYQDPQLAGAHLEEITLSGFANINTSNDGDDFDFEIWNCYGNGGILDPVTNENTNIFGNVNHYFSVEGAPGSNGYPDYAFKMYPAEDNSFRTTNPDKYYNDDVGTVNLENDTLLWSSNPIPVEPATDPKIKYHYWDFGNGVTSNDPKTTITYSKPGNYLVTYSTLNSNSDTVTYMQKIVILDRTKPIKAIALNDIVIYPNPTNYGININYGSGMEIKNIKVIDNTGRVIVNMDNTMPNTIDLKNYPVGLYQILFIMEKEIISKKIIKQ